MNVLWIQRLTCCGNTHSFLNYEHLDILLKRINLLYHPSLSLKEEREVIENVLREKVRLDVLVVEGAVFVNDSEVKRLCQLARVVLALGSCASYGNVPALASDSVCGLQYRFKDKGGLLGADFLSSGGMPVINLSGCPAHPQWLIG
ncbi:NADH-quinone oxidoreductase subunit B family protein [Thermocrinis sp.]